MASSTATLADACVPVLLPGSYEITASYALSVDTAAREEAKRKLTVTAPRFALTPGEVLRCYPPPGSTGPFSATLPHIALGRPTLPWERLRRPDSAEDPADREPWLALLVFGPGEVLEDPQAIGHVTTTTVREWQSDRLSRHADLGPLTDAEKNTPCRTIRLAPEVFRAVVPVAAGLRYLAHVRQAPPAVQEAGGLAGVPDAVSVVTGNGLPRPPGPPRGHPVPHVAHLVSLEGLPAVLSDLAGGTPTDAEGGVDGMPVRLLSLHAWSFVNQADSHPPFAATMADLVAEMRASGGLLQLPGAPPDAPGMTVGQLREGRVPVRQAVTAAGKKSAPGDGVWRLYRGPLSAVPATDPGLTDIGRAADAVLPKDAGDTDLAADISHADAWSLGRSLALASADIFSTIDAAHPAPDRSGNASDRLGAMVRGGLADRCASR
ncbi:hypothetical protein [Streptomyces sp. XD-27]|uniref:hypothetical protein n=1 Tax=Streptomyces sp. XD-27 TaxID=3062779 RepID=UPI0026F4473A|nr:hypothetical protein [Streptomyces sp. XD-27]WKX74066.1 hypothetical protein Q3Y56_33140 [Streptomyces sp. XD-27]